MFFDGYQNVIRRDFIGIHIFHSYQLQGLAIPDYPVSSRSAEPVTQIRPMGVTIQSYEGGIHPDICSKHMEFITPWVIIMQLLGPVFQAVTLKIFEILRYGRVWQ